MSTSNAIAAGIYTAIGTALGYSVYRSQAPDNATFPYIIFSHYAGGPLNQTPSDLRDEVYFIRAYGWSQAQVGTIDAAISAALHCGSLTVSGYTCMSLWREQDLELVDNQPSGQPIYMAGALYRISIDG